MTTSDKKDLTEIAGILGIPEDKALQLAAAIKNLNARKPVIIAGRSCRMIAQKIADILECKILPLKDDLFNNGEPDVEFTETVRGEVAFFVQSFRTGKIAEDLLATEAIADAFSRAGGKTLHGVPLIFPCARQDRRENNKKTNSPKRRPITAKIVARRFEAIFDSIITVHLHAEQIEGFFDKIPVENINPATLFTAYLEKEGLFDEDVVIGAPDVGAANSVSNTAAIMNCLYVIVDKRRSGPGQNEVINIVGNVAGKIVVLIDDQIDSAGTLCKAAEKLIELGAKDVIAIATHYVGTAGALDRLLQSKISKVIVTDTIPTPELEGHDKIVVLPIAQLMAKVFAAVFNNKTLQDAVAHRVNGKTNGVKKEKMLNS